MFMKSLKKKKYGIYLPVVILSAALLSGCGSTEDGAKTEPKGETEAGTKAEVQPDMEGSGLAYETAADSHIDFEALKEENPDIFAWLSIPGTNVDTPILQSAVSDDFYKTHTADGKEGTAGALYTEMPNMMDMCDFNTIIHGKDTEEGNPFEDLHLFEDPDFFAEHDKFYIYLPDNVLTYEVFAAYYDEDSDILRRYDYTTWDGCESYLEQIYGLRDMSKNQREGWEDLTPSHFLVTLNGSIREEDETQYVVIGVLTGDAADKIDRVILD